MSKLLFIIIGINIFCYKLSAQEDSLFNSAYNDSTKYIDPLTPDSIPRVYLSELFDYSQKHIHSSPVFNKEMTEMYFSLYEDNELPQKIFYTKKIDSKWITPTLINFSGEYQDGGPVLSTDDNTIYFYSRRPIKGVKERKVSAIWFAKQERDTWGTPSLLLRSDTSNTYLPCYVKDSVIYYTVSDNTKRYSIYKGVIRGNKIINEVKLGENINSDTDVNSHLFLNNTEEYMFFWRYNRDDVKERGIYISFKDSKSEWGTPLPLYQLLGLENTRFPYLTPDGKYFIFTSVIKGVERLYWVDASFVTD